MKTQAELQDGNRLKHVDGTSFTIWNPLVDGMTLEEVIQRMEHPHWPLDGEVGFMGLMDTELEHARRHVVRNI